MAKAIEFFTLRWLSLRPPNVVSSLFPYKGTSLFYLYKKSPIRFRNPMELNNSNAASAFFAFLPFYSFTFKKGYRIFHFSFFPFPLNAASAFFTFLLFYL